MGGHWIAHGGGQHHLELIDGERVLLLRGFSADAPETTAREAESMAIQAAGGVIRSGAPLRGRGAAR